MLVKINPKIKEFAMKKLGLIGSVGVESTIPYYKGIVYGVQKCVGKPFFQISQLKV